MFKLKVRKIFLFYSNTLLSFYLGVKAYVSQASEKTLINLILSDLRILDPYKEARYRKVWKTNERFSSEKALFFFQYFQIISQQNNDKELLRVDLSLFNYPEGFEKSVDIFDCDVKVEFAKATIVFLYKHIDAILVNDRFVFFLIYFIYCFIFYVLEFS